MTTRKSLGEVGGVPTSMVRCIETDVRGEGKWGTRYLYDGKRYTQYHPF